MEINCFFGVFEIGLSSIGPKSRGCCIFRIIESIWLKLDVLEGEISQQIWWSRLIASDTHPECPKKYLHIFSSKLCLAKPVLISHLFLKLRDLKKKKQIAVISYQTKPSPSSCLGLLSLFLTLVPWIYSTNTQSPGWLWPVQFLKRCSDKNPVKYECWLIFLQDHLDFNGLAESSILGPELWICQTKACDVNAL